LEGIVTWAFEFEDQPYYIGYRELATNGIDKPILNLFRMLGMLGRDSVEVSDPASLNTERVVQDGVRGEPDIAPSQPTATTASRFSCGTTTTTKCPCSRPR